MLYESSRHHQVKPILYKSLLIIRTLLVPYPPCSPIHLLRLALTRQLEPCCLTVTHNAD